MKRKEVEDVMGGKEAWENVDKADGRFMVLIFLMGIGRICEECVLMTFPSLQHNAQEKDVMARKRFSTRCRFGVRMSL